MMRRVNLIPPEFSSGKKAWVESGLWQYAFAGAVILGGGILIHGISTWLSLSLISNDVANLESKVSKSRTWAEQVEQSQSALEAQLKNINKRIKNLEQKEAYLKGLQNPSSAWSDLLQAFEEQIPEKAWIDNLILTDLRQGESRVVGGGYSNKEVSIFLENLNKSKYFQNATFVRTEAGELNKEKIIRFELTFEVARAYSAGG